MKRSAVVIMMVCGLLWACKTSIPNTVPNAAAIDNAPAGGAASFKTAGATYTGGTSADGLVDYFYGIPFARPPVDDLRWMPPQPALHATKTIEATNFAAACMQGPHLSNWYKNVITSFGGDPSTFPVPRFSEDCLYLNIWRPRIASGSLAQNPLPVFVFIHGGSNKGGWSFEPNYLGERLARRGVIVVTIAYRVGVFGFFAHPQLPQSNFGLLDQIAALQWIRQHIAELGGDPDRVTVGGESAGANNIDHLLASPMAQGLFQRVIHQSGGSPMLNRTSLQEHAGRGRQLAARVLGTEHARDISALRKAPAAAVLAAAKDVYGGAYYEAVVDGHSVTVPFKRAVDSGAIAQVDILIGSNADEWLMYMDAEETIDRWLAKNRPDMDVQAIKSTLEQKDSRVQQLDKLITGHNFTCPSLKLAEAIAQGGGRSWVYYFARQREGELAATMGAYHGAELPYVFGTHDDWLPTSAADRALTESIMDYWSGFIHRGNPNTVGRPVWPVYTQRGDAVQILDSRISTATHDSQKLCDLLQP